MLLSSRHAVLRGESAPAGEAPHSAQTETPDLVQGAPRDAGVTCHSRKRSLLIFALWWWPVVARRGSVRVGTADWRFLVGST